LSASPHTPLRGAYSAPPDPLAIFRGAILLGRREGEGWRMGEEGKRWREFVL